MKYSSGWENLKALMVRLAGIICGMTFLSTSSPDGWTECRSAVSLMALICSNLLSRFLESNFYKMFSPKETGLFLFHNVGWCFLTACWMLYSVGGMKVASAVCWMCAWKAVSLLYNARPRFSEFLRFINSPLNKGNLKELGTSLEEIQIWQPALLWLI